MYRGGVEKTLLNWISTIDNNRYKVTILLINKEGAFLNKLPDYVEVKIINGLADILNGGFYNRIWNIRKNKGILKSIIFFIKTLQYKITKNRGVYYKWLVKQLPESDEKYDYVISYTMPDSICVPYSAIALLGEYKWMWCHIDVNFYKNNELLGMEKHFEKFDAIINVGEKAKESFDKRYPSLSSRSKLIYNILNYSEIDELKKQHVDIYDETCTLLTVGRITWQKGQDIAVRAAKILYDKGYKFKWYFVGPKSDIQFFNEIKNYIKSNNMNNVIFYLGETDNPYKYMAKCDFYVQPSRFEGFCTTISEALYIGKIVIASDVAGVQEQIINEETGYIVNLDDYNDLAKIIEQCINDPLNKRRIEKNLSDKVSKKITFDKVLIFLKNI